MNTKIEVEIKIKNSKYEAGSAPVLKHILKHGPKADKKTVIACACVSSICSFVLLFVLVKIPKDMNSVRIGHFKRYQQRCTKRSLTIVTEHLKI